MSSLRHVPILPQCLCLPALIQEKNKSEYFNGCRQQNLWEKAGLSEQRMARRGSCKPVRWERSLVFPLSSLLVLPQVQLQSQTWPLKTWEKTCLSQLNFVGECPCLYEIYTKLFEHGRVSCWQLIQFTFFYIHGKSKFTYMHLLQSLL